MHAVIRTGGKQYRVAAGDELNIEKITGADKGSTLVFREVLALGQGSDLVVGKPLVEGAAVHADVVTVGKARKVRIFKKKRRKGYQVHRGHRQPFTRIRITSIEG
jgi:large subunit ribosomal protein L21